LASVDEALHEFLISAAGNDSIQDFSGVPVAPTGYRLGGKTIIAKSRSKHQANTTQSQVREEQFL